MAGKGTSIVRDAVLVFVALGCMAIAVHHQKVHYAKWHQGSGKYIQRVRLPNAEQIKIAAVGYDNVYADFLTLKAVQAFGAAWESEDGRTEPIYDYFDILTTLDPKFPEVYEFANLVLSDEHGDDGSGENRGHKQALELMRKGLRHNPDRWNLAYLGMYTSLWGMQDGKLANEFLGYAKKIPGTPDHVLRMEEYIARQSGAYYSAFDVNLGHYLGYVDRGLEAEQEVALRKVAVIIDGWNRVELARACQAYLEETGDFPSSMEELLQSKHVPRFKAPTPEALGKSLNAHAADGEGLREKIDAIREAAMEEIVGLPPEPTGTWYFIDQEKLATARQSARPEGKRLDKEHDYIVTLREKLETVDFFAGRMQGEIMGMLNATKEPPTAFELKDALVDDVAGGHWVYFPSVEDENGQKYPRFFSTTQIRVLKRLDPRLGLRGTVENFPRREFPITKDQTPYLQSEPSIWDFPEDQTWALCRGFEPPFRPADHPTDVQDKARNALSYLDCDQHLPVPGKGEDPNLRP